MITPDKADELYMSLLELSDLDFGEPVYMGDGVFILPDGSTYDESGDSND
jgi:hypothetical protein